jgi:hypothetical protein
MGKRAPRSLSKGMACFAADGTRVSAVHKAALRIGQGAPWVASSAGTARPILCQGVRFIGRPVGAVIGGHGPPYPSSRILSGRPVGAVIGGHGPPYPSSRSLSGRPVGADFRMCRVRAAQGV